MEKMGNVKEEIGNVSREVEGLKKKSKVKTRKQKHSERNEHGPIRTLERTEESIHDYEGMSLETSQTEK